MSHNNIKSSLIKIFIPNILFLATIILFTWNCANIQKSNAKVETGSQGDALPNIIFYLSDDQDVYDYGCYGNEKVNTPTVDLLAKEGMLFTSAFTGQAICAPSRSQLLTGKYPLKNGCFANHTKTKPDIKSMTKYMRDLGYEVIRAGKSHISPPSVYDWDHAWNVVEKPTGPRGYIPLDSIENYFQAAKKPFVMFIASAYPHGEYYDVENYDVEEIEFFPFNIDLKEDKDFVKSKAGYYRSIEEDDKQLFKVLNLVNTYLDKKNTLFIYSADHGISGKFTVKDVGLKVPFIARWPNVISAGTKSDQLIHYTDVLPTFIEIAGGKIDSDMDGTSFLPILQGQDVEINKYVFGVRTNQNILRSEIFPSRMIRDRRYKYIRNFNAFEVLDKNLGSKPNVNVFIRRGALHFKEEAFEELYDLKDDPYELNNVIANQDLQDVKIRLMNEMFTWMKGQGDFLNDQFGNLPIITPKEDRRYNLDRNTRRRTIPDSLKNSLREEDFYIIEHW